MLRERERFHLHGGSVSPGSLRALCASTQVSVTHSDSVLAGTRPTPAAGGSEGAFSSATTYSLPPMCKARARRQHWPRKWHPHALSQPGSKGVLYPTGRQSQLSFRAPSECSVCGVLLSPRPPSPRFKFIVCSTCR